MTEDKELKELRKEVHELKQTVYTLKDTIVELTSRFKHSTDAGSPYDSGQYNVFSNQGNCLEGNVSWDRLVNLLHEEDLGLTATELSEKWGRSRSRTSEVLNKLVGDGHIVKFRDGRQIRFRTTEE
ncbi:MAG: winged helix-turn-helix transcriptional regulator [Candidatus Thorarchaeota archaeon]|nr:winged helix-turn-helix transcriptional regulator [Candidatus Thorarchaeota archaeon]